jgi:hypothetical protein
MGNGKFNVRLWIVFVWQMIRVNSGVPINQVLELSGSVNMGTAQPKACSISRSTHLRGKVKGKASPVTGREGP